MHSSFVKKVHIFQARDNKIMKKCYSLFSLHPLLTHFLYYIVIYICAFPPTLPSLHTPSFSHPPFFPEPHSPLSLLTLPLPLHVYQCNSTPYTCMPASPLPLRHTTAASLSQKNATQYCFSVIAFISYLFTFNHPNHIEWRFLSIPSHISVSFTHKRISGMTRGVVSCRTSHHIKALGFTLLPASK